MKMLIVDDEINNRLLLQKLVASYGSTDVVVDGREAVEAFALAISEGASYDLIFMDNMMPDMDGHEAVQAIRAKEREINVSPRDEVKILMVTALDSPKEVMRAYYRDGCTDYITKPITKEKIQTKMKEYVGE